ncbi:MAG: preprotein translocase subunit YajC [Propionibacteriaceae bacterium]|nr:preprotein translocase subunit YajC [Propionibacteriaceae bacterium]
MDLSTLALIALMGGAVYFLMIRPQQKKAKEQAAHMASMEPGSRVMMVSGIIGTIKYLGDKQAIVEISPGVEMTIDKRAISTQPVEDEFEYADDAGVAAVDDGTEDDALAEPATTAELTAAETETTAASEPEDTDGPTWDAPGTTRN